MVTQAEAQWGDSYHCETCQGTYTRGASRQACPVKHQPGDCCHYGDIKQQKGGTMAAAPTKEQLKGGSVQGIPLREALRLVENDRNDTYGPPHEDFERTVGQLNALGYRGPGGRLLLPRDWAVMANAAKQSRLVATPHHYDSVVDQAGYAGCYWDCVIAEQEQEEQSK